MTLKIVLARTLKYPPRRTFGQINCYSVDYFETQGFYTFWYPDDFTDRRLQKINFHSHMTKFVLSFILNQTFKPLLSFFAIYQAFLWLGTMPEALQPNYLLDMLWTDAKIFFSIYFSSKPYGWIKVWCYTINT